MTQASSDSAEPACCFVENAPGFVDVVAVVQDLRAELAVLRDRDQRREGDDRIKALVLMDLVAPEPLVIVDGVLLGDAVRERWALAKHGPDGDLDGRVGPELDPATVQLPHVVRGQIRNVDLRLRPLRSLHAVAS